MKIRYLLIFIILLGPFSFLLANSSPAFARSVSEPGGMPDYCTSGSLGPPFTCEDKCSCEFQATQCGSGSRWSTSGVGNFHNCDPTFLRENNLSGCIPDSSCGSFNNTPVGDVIGVITTPSFIQSLGFGTYGLNTFLSRLIALIYAIAGVIFVFMVIFGAFQWITSGGDKEAVGKARGRITHAIIGITLLALSFVIIQILGTILAVPLFAGQK